MGGVSHFFGTKRLLIRSLCGSPFIHNGDAVSVADNKSSMESSAENSTVAVLGLQQILAK